MIPKINNKSLTRIRFFKLNSNVFPMTIIPYLCLKIKVFLIIIVKPANNHPYLKNEIKKPQISSANSLNKKIYVFVIKISYQLSINHNLIKQNM